MTRGRRQQLLAEWGLDPCGDNSCLLGSPGGMATNGGCTCVDRVVEELYPHGSERLSRREMEIAAIKLLTRRYAKAIRRAVDHIEAHENAVAKLHSAGLVSYDLEAIRRLASADTCARDVIDDREVDLRSQVNTLHEIAEKMTGPSKRGVLERIKEIQDYLDRTSLPRDSAKERS